MHGANGCDRSADRPTRSVAAGRQASGSEHQDAAQLASSLRLALRQWRVGRYIGKGKLSEDVSHSGELRNDMH
jgi:hypothetical protein